MGRKAVKQLGDVVGDCHKTAGQPCATCWKCATLLSPTSHAVSMTNLCSGGPLGVKFASNSWTQCLAQALLLRSAACQRAVVMGACFPQMVVCARKPTQAMNFNAQ